ncbi:MAG TPA: flagellar hook-associated protein FlgK [Clostridia bacterium]|nr:flagellar hook-associated protein FlgK [Clostridia bacterium]
MSSTFSCYQIAKSGVYTSQRALEVIGHNLSNADTVGYVRQQMLQADNRPQIYSGKQIGTGTSVSEIRQVRSAFLDNAYRKENSLKGYWNARQSTIEDVESILDSLSENNGLGAAIDDFFQGWEELAKDPEDRTSREAVVEYGNYFAEIVNEIAEQLDQLQSNLDEQINSLVSEINSIADQVAELNQIILVNENNGQNANDYRDQRNLLLDTLSGYMGIEVTEAENGMINVYAGGRSIVRGNNSCHMDCSYNTSNGSFATVVWENSGEEVRLKDGKLFGFIEARGDVYGGEGSVDNGSPIESAVVDDDSDSYTFSSESMNFISELRTGLNMLVSLMTRKINSIHGQGKGLDGSNGLSFFARIDENLPFEAGNIKVNPELSDPNKIAASRTGSAGDADIANEIVDFRNIDYFKNDSLKMNINDFYNLLVDWVGTAGQEAASFFDNQSTLVLLADNNRQSVSAVSMDEELANMIKYQHSYNASARVMTTIDSMMENIINSMGRAGR